MLEHTAERLDRALVAKRDLTGLHDQSQTAVDRVGGLVLLGGHLCAEEVPWDEFLCLN